MECGKTCEPINSFEEVLIYANKNVKKNDYHVFPRNTVSYFHQKFDCHVDEKDYQLREKNNTQLVPKTLICHDMKGGYLHDKYINGCSDGNGYTFYRWSNIDIFIYFSHHFVTIPPHGWINLAHQHNVKILGTLITESASGLIICNKILENENTWRKFAQALVNITLIYKFDGWLLNIENIINDTKSLISFIKYLTEELHKINDEFLVLWYDSVTIDGKLKWQNELNENNMCYFNVCDGIFLNYSWNQVNLNRSAKNAGERILDVFVGVDVFGRNFFGGGGFRCDIAAKEIRGCGLSMAIFAQGWTHEKLHPKTLNNFYEIFLHKDNAFWLKLYIYLYTRPIMNEFVTTFYTGADKDNYNLNLQEKFILSPVHSGQTYFTDYCQNFCECLQLYDDGCKPNRFSYLITTNKLEKNKDFIHRLFTCDIIVERNLCITIVTKEGNKVNNLLMIIVMENKQNKYQLLRSESEKPEKILEEFKDINKEWQIKQFKFSLMEPLKLVEIGIKLDGKPILLGGFALHLGDCPSSSKD